MNIGDAREIISSTEREIAAEKDPKMAAWYEVESKLQPDYVEAVQAMDQVGVLAGQLSQVLKLKEAAEIVNVPQDTEGADENELQEEPAVLTPEEILRAKIEKKYETCLEQYEEDLENVTAAKRSKRQRAERAARKQFARNFTDFTDVTGDEHIALRADLLKLAFDEVIEDGALIDEVIENTVAYTEQHGKEVSSDPKNFAEIISESVLLTKPNAKRFDRILGAVFAPTTKNTSDYPDINLNIAHSVFELIDDFDALVKITAIAYFQKPYMTSGYAYEVLKSVHTAYEEGDVATLIEQRQAVAVFDIVSQMLVGLQPPTDPKVWAAYDRIEKEYGPMLAENPDFECSSLAEWIYRTPENLMDYDPVSVKDAEGSVILEGQWENASIELKAALQKSPLFQKRMKHLAPYGYGVAAAKQVTGNRGVHAQLMPISPHVTADAFIPIYTNAVEPTSEEHIRLTDRVEELALDIMSTIRNLAETDVSPYSKTSPLRMISMPLFEGSKQDGTIIYRPSMPFDRRPGVNLLPLAINFYRKNQEQNGSMRMEDLESQAKEYEKHNEELRQEIKARQKRFLGRRPIQFTMPEEFQQTGLISVNLRFDPNKALVQSSFKLEEGEVEVPMTPDFRINITSPDALTSGQMQPYYENIVLRLVKIWATSNEVQTSEGVVSEASGNSANMGHFAYLRIQGGRKYEFSEHQRKLCLEEQGRDLAEESERLRPLDPTGQGRNSTYVRENYDPNKPPLHVYYSQKDIEDPPL